jgi:hypothetical protein
MLYLMSAVLFLDPTMNVSMAVAVSLPYSFASVCMMLNTSCVVLRLGVLGV